VVARKLLILLLKLVHVLAALNNWIHSAVEPLCTIENSGIENAVLFLRQQCQRISFNTIIIVRCHPY